MIANKMRKITVMFLFLSKYLSIGIQLKKKDGHIYLIVKNAKISL